MLAMQNLLFKRLIMRYELLSLPVSLFIVDAYVIHLEDSYVELTRKQQYKTSESV